MSTSIERGSGPDLVADADRAEQDSSPWAPARRALTLGLVASITLVAFEAMAVATVMPQVQDDLGGLALYGWVFSGFFLATIVGVVVGGQLADRRGVVIPFTVGMVMFVTGLVIGAAATSMEMLIVGRLFQGFGAGAVPSTAYTAIALGYPRRARPTMFAVLSAAWVVPGVAGPAVASAVEHALNWRWVFGGLIPVVLVASGVAVRALVNLERSRAGRREPPPAGAAAADRGRLRQVAVLVTGAAMVLAAATTAPPVPLGVLLIVAGFPLGAWAFVSLVPAGTVRLAPGVPATIAVRGLLTWSFFGADAYLPLGITDGRGAPTWLAGVALSASAVLWATGSWTQARVIDRYGPRRLDGLGFTAIALGTTLLGATVWFLPPWFSVPAWGLAGFGMGLAYAPLSVTVLSAARPGEEGKASAALHLSDNLGVVLGTGAGGALVALGDSQAWSVNASVVIAFIPALLVTVVGLAASRRLPRVVPDGPEEAVAVST